MKFNKKNVETKTKPSRKQLRKEKRIEKKVRKNEFFTKSKKHIAGQFVRNPNLAENRNKNEQNSKEKSQGAKVVNDNKIQEVINVEQHRNKEKKEQKKLEREMLEQRNKQLTLANEIEDRNIKKLEKQLKLNKRKSKGVPKSFNEDGLGYLLEVCDPDGMKSVVAAEQQFADINNDFEEDFALMTGKTINPKEEKSVDSQMSDDDIFSDDFDMLEEESDGADSIISDTQSDEEIDVSGEMPSDLDNSEDDTVNNKRRIDNKKDSQSIKKKKTENENTDKYEEDESDFNIDDQSMDNSEDDDENSVAEENEDDINLKGGSKANPDGTWEDIYGRLRNKDGSLVTESSQKYIPPAVRAKMAQEASGDKKALEKLNRLKKQLKGLTNRLAESNMHNISVQIEDLYMNNSRNDVNDTLTNLLLDAIIPNIITPERLLMEHVLLIAILHSNVGSEVGAHFLQTVIVKFDENLKNSSVEDKTLDNIVAVLAQLYNFKLFDAKLMYEILNKLAENFVEKNIDCILRILRNVGFNLRKDDPLALKDLILELQKKAATISENAVSGTRVKFLLDILLAIKNNNVSKIPNYDNTYSEHLKKIMKGFIRKGNYVTQLNISLEDLLKAEEKGKWWVVGSAWTGKTTDNKATATKQETQVFSQKLLKAARKHRMNTDTRRNIFCIIMSAEDYLDAFEKLLHLGLTNNQDREIVHVILHCCLKEKKYNPYYAYLAQRFCDYDRKYQLTIKFSIWDKLKALGEQSSSQMSNLAKLLTHLFLEKGLPISTLKIVEFSELDKVTLRFIRQILLGILLHEDMETVTEVFKNVAQSEKLKMFRESLRLFIEHFLLKNINSESIDEKQKEILQTRGKIIGKLLVMKDRMRF